jgi:hypothetical protein
MMATINETDARLSTHEEVCAFRYESINALMPESGGLCVMRAHVGFVKKVKKF